MFSELPVRAQQWRDFASAHSRGLRLGLAVKLPCRYWLCLSAFVRVATMIFTAYSNLHTSLPQRIRAGCDCGKAMQRTANLLREGR